MIPSQRQTSSRIPCSIIAIRLRTLLFLLLFQVPWQPSLVAAQEERPLEQLRWILGDWTSASDASLTSESWADADGVFRGTGRVVANDDKRIRSQEVMVLIVIGEEVYYIAKPRQNQMPVPFELIESSSRHAIFENRSHDFPKRIVYERKSADAMLVTVGDGADKSFQIDFTREKAQPLKSKEPSIRE